MDKESKQQLHQLTETVTALGATVTTLTESVASLTSSVADLKAEMQGVAKVDEQFVEVKQDIVELKQHQAAMQENIANLQDSTYDFNVNLNTLNRLIGIGFAKTTEQISVLKRDMIEIERELFLERGIRETDADELR